MDDELRKVAESLWDHIMVGSPEECWPWTGARSGRGYGNVTRKVHGRKQTFGVHRLIFELVKGTPTPGRCICHSCDNRICSNPAHLWEGTHKDNTTDMMTKGRGHMAGTRGEQSGMSKLTEQQVREIRATGKSVRQIDLAAKYGVGQSHISRVLHATSWAHLTDLS